MCVGKFWQEKNWRIVNYLPKKSSPIFTDTPKIYLAYALTLAYLLNFSSPIAFTCMVCTKISPIKYSCGWYMLYNVFVNVGVLLYVNVGVLGLHCLEYNGKGGETMVLDGFQVAEHIQQTRPDYFTLLSKVSIPYHLKFKDGTYRSRKIIFPVNEEGEVIDVYLNHDDRRPLDNQSQMEIQSASGCDPSEAVARFYNAIRHLHSLIYGDQFVHEFTLAPGQLLMINNRRLFHGRKEFSGYRKLCGAIINREEYQSTLEILETK